MTSRTLALCAVLCIALAPAPSEVAASERSTTITVVPFVALDSAPEAWLGKGIADLLMRDLARSGNLAVLERDQL